MINKQLILLVSILTLAACQPQSSTSSASGLAGAEQALQKFTVADLQAADADAKAHGDTIASTCYEALIPAVQSQTANLPAALPAGLFTAFQEGRDGIDAIEDVPAGLKGLNVACGPLVLDAEQTVVALGLKVAPAALPLPTLP